MYSPGHTNHAGVNIHIMYMHHDYQMYHDYQTLFTGRTKLSIQTRLSSQQVEMNQICIYNKIYCILYTIKCKSTQLCVTDKTHCFIEVSEALCYSNSRWAAVDSYSLTSVWLNWN